MNILHLVANALYFYIVSLRHFRYISNPFFGQYKKHSIAIRLLLHSQKDISISPEF